MIHTNFDLISSIKIHFSTFRFEFGSISNNMIKYEIKETNKEKI